MREIERRILRDMIDNPNSCLSTNQKTAIASILAGETSTKKFSVETNLGTIVAEAGTDENYPGVYVDFIPTEGYRRPAVVVECDISDDNPDGEGIRILTYGEKGNIDEDSDYTSKSVIYTKEDLPLAASKLTPDAKQLVIAMANDSKYQIIGGSYGLALVKDVESGKFFKVDVQEMPES